MFLTAKEYEKAVEALGSYLLLNPDNEDMVQNQQFYVKKLGFHDAHFTPREVSLGFL